MTESGTSGVPTAEELRESAREAWRNAPHPARNDDEFEERWLSRHLADALAENADLRARIEAAIDYFESDAWERVEPGELRRILHGE